MGTDWPNDRGGLHLLDLKRKVQPIILLCTGIACNMMNVHNGVLGCRLGCGILLV